MSNTVTSLKKTQKDWTKSIISWKFKIDYSLMVMQIYLEQLFGYSPLPVELQ